MARQRARQGPERHAVAFRSGVSQRLGKSMKAVWSLTFAPDSSILAVGWGSGVVGLIAAEYRANDP